MNKKKAIIIIVAVIAVVLVGLAIFYFFFAKQNPDSSGGTLPGNVPPGTFPTGGGTGSTTPGGTGTTPSTGTTPGGAPSGQNQPKTFQSLRQISSLPVAGAIVFEKNTANTVRYIERGTGHVFEVSADQAETPRRISNTTIPKIYEAYWFKDGQSFIIRYLKGKDDVQTFYSSLGKSSSTSQDVTLSGGTFLPTNISTLTVSPSQTKIFYTFTQGDVTYGVLADPNGERKNQVINSPASEWQVNWGQEGTLFMTTKPSAQIPGNTYTLSTQGGGLRKVAGGINGLTVLPNNKGTFLLYSQNANGGFELRLLDIAKNTSSAFPTNTLPEKCIWSKTDANIVYCAVPGNLPGQALPDSWYQGAVSFADSIVRINLKTGETNVVLNPITTAKRELDIINLSLNPKEDRLIFMNKNDLSLWLLDLSKVSN